MSLLTMILNSTSSHPMEYPREDDDHLSIIMPISFDYPSVTINGEGLTIVSVEGVDDDRRGLALSLPVKIIPVELPVNSISISVTMDDVTTRKIPFNGMIQRNPGPIPGADPSLFEMIEDDIPAPEEHFQYDIGTGINLETKETMMKMSLKVFPVIPSEGYLEYLESALISIEYIPPSIEPFDMVDEYDLLIICPDQFTDKMEEYALYRNQTGIRAIVINLTAIGNDSIFNISGSDKQEEIKMFIERARSHWSVDSVLLSGDVDVLPARQIMVIDGYDDSGSIDGRFLPSDLYFADLYKGGTTEFCTWNEYTSGNHDLLWGEYNGGNQDGADLYPDVTIGRIPASNVDELSLMLEKVRMYELNAIGSDWFMNATLCGTNTFTYSGHGDTSGINEGEMISDLIGNGPLSEFTATKHYESLVNISSSQIANTVNNGCGFFEMANHGGYSGWGYTNGGVSVTSTLAYELDNGYRLPVVVLDACLTHGFDNENASEPGGNDPVYGLSYYPPGSTYSWRDCLGEYFHKAPNGGAIATIGCTRVGYGGHGNYHDDRYSGYMNYHVHKAFSDGFVRTGEMLSKAWEDYLNNIGKGGAYNYKTLTEYILLGDPTVTVGGVQGANISIRTNSLEEDILPGQTVSVEFNITNSGFISSAVNIHPSLNGKESEGWTSSTNPITDVIEPDQIINGTLYVTAPDQVVMGETITATIVVSSLIINEPETHDITVTVGRKWSLELKNDPGQITTKRGKRISGYLNVTNTGNGPESLTIDFEGLGDDWVVFLAQPTYDIDPYDDERIPFQIEVAFHSLAGIYDIIVNVSSNLDPAFTTDILAVEVRIERNLNLEGPDNRLDIMPGSTGEAIFRLDNLGNSNVTVSMGWGRTELPGWSLEMNRTSMEIGAFSSDVILVSAGVPEGTPPLTYRIHVNVTDGFTSTSASVVINVSRIYDYSADCLENVKKHSTIGATTFEIEIENLGNIYDMFSIGNEGNSEDWKFTASPVELSVEPKEIKTVFVSFSRIFPLMGNYTFDILVSPGSSALPTMIRLTIVVEGIHDMELDIFMDRTGSLPGENLSGLLNLTSLSNCRDSYIIEITVPDDFEYIVIDPDVTIDPGTFEERSFTISVPENGLAGTYTILFSVISMESHINRTVSRVIRIKEIYDIEMYPVSIIEEVMEPGTTYEIIFGLSNNGNSDDNVDLGLNTSDYIRSWVRLEYVSLNGIKPGTTRNIRVYITVPSWNVTEGEYNLSMEISSIGMDIRTDNLTIQVRGSDDEGNGRSVNLTILSIVIAAALGIITATIIFGLIVNKRRSGEDIKDLGLEWEEDEEWDWEDDE